VDLITGSKILRVEGYNEDETYPHTIIFRFTVAIPFDDPLLAINEVLRDRLPIEPSPYLVSIPDILTEIVNTKLVLENYVVPILRKIYEQDKDRYRAEIHNKTLEELARL
ncbi:unnamed protein product, partial [marine sediment metagenome]